jgi:Leucine-rich repeat (LRR) protein
MCPRCLAFCIHWRGWRAADSIFRLLPSLMSLNLDNNQLESLPDSYVAGPRCPCQRRP